MEQLQKFDEMIDTVQKAVTAALNERQKEAILQKYEFAAEFEYGRDEIGRYVLRAQRDMFAAMAYYFALSYEEDTVDVRIEARLNGSFYTSVCYGIDCLHVEELFQFLDQAK